MKSTADECGMEGTSDFVSRMPEMYVLDCSFISMSLLNCLVRETDLSLQGSSNNCVNVSYIFNVEWNIEERNSSS